MDLYKRYSLSSILTKGATKAYNDVPQERVGQLITDITFENKEMSYAITIMPTADKFRVIIEYL